MNTKKFAAILSVAVVMCTLCGVFFACNGEKTPKEITSDTLNVKQVDLPENFVMGMDASAVISLEKSNVKYYNFDGKEEDVFKILADSGINTIRVRVWNNPYDSDGNGFGGGNCDINTALQIGKRATQYGMSLMVNFHYSDFWADPSKQKAPRAWSSMKMSDAENENKPNALYQYTKESLQKLADAKVKVSMVQVGNETNGGMAGETEWKYICKLMNSGSRAVREVFPSAQVVAHFTNPEKDGLLNYFAKQLSDGNVDYDVFATSYYPYWHGTLKNLTTVLSKVATTYEKKVMVAETSYAYTAADTDFYQNTVGSGDEVTGYVFSVQGQADSVRDVIDCVANTANGIGVCYWEGTWISVGKQSRAENSVLWEKYGSGWASSYSKVYDPDDAGKYYGGCSVDNQAFFDADGKALESLKVWALVKTGNSAKQRQAK